RMKGAVITGVGVVSPLGLGFPAFLDGLAAQRVAVGPIGAFDARAFPCTVAAEVPAGAALPPMPGVRDRKIVLGVAAAREAWAHAGCGPAERVASLVLAVGLEQAFLEDFGPLVAG